jgi:hypothetical protein
MLLRRLSLLTAVLLLMASAATAHAAQPGFAGTVTRYVDPSQQTLLSFGDRSHWLQPWRAYLDTVPATTLRNAVGIQFNVSGSEAPATARLLAANGFRRARLEESWANVSYSNPDALTNDSEFRATLRALKDYGIRPLILLNAHQGLPCPAKPFTAVTVDSATQGDRQVHLAAATASQVVPGRTGFNSLTGEYKAADVIFTAVDANGWATLSKPLPRDLPAGGYSATTLKYEPFWRPLTSAGSASSGFEETLSGWLDYVGLVTGTARSVLGSDAFDVEVWNEQSFGADFLDINTYYNPPIDDGQGDATAAILKRTVAYLRDPAHGVSGIGIGNGFASQRPWDAGSTSPLGLTAIDKHPYLYSGMRRFPDTVQVDETRPLDAQGNVDGWQDAQGDWHENFTPSYDSFEPEYYLTATQKMQRYYGFPIQMDSLIRDMSPITTLLNGTPHGRNTAPAGGSPPGMWITEMNIDPVTADPAAGFTAGDRLHFQAKMALRTLASFVNKGASAVDFYAVKAGNLALVSDSFFNSLQQTGSYPGDGAGGEVMDSVRRLIGAFSGATSIASPRSLSLQQIGDYAGHAQFAGDGTAAHPTLYNRDVVAFLPFQVTSSRFVIPVYVMTTDMGKIYKPSAPTTDPTRFDMPPESYRLTIGGVKGSGAKVSATDPLTGSTVPVKVVSRGTSQVALELGVTDSPRLLTIQEG